MQGNPDIDVLMIPTSKAIKKHVKDRDAFTEIYNRAYEAVMISMEVKEAERNKLAEAVGLMTTLKPTMVVDSAHPVEMALEVSEYITQLTAERDEWKQDAERLAKSFVIEVYLHEWVCRSGCHHMGKTPDTIDHAPNCPITLHRELVAKYGGENNQADVCNGGENNART